VVRSRAASTLCALLLAAVSTPFSESGDDALSAQDSGALPNAAAVVTPHTFVSMEPVPLGKEFQVAVVVDIMRGFHMNSHKPSDQYLIPTTLTPQLPAGIGLVEIVYPPGKLEKFAFSPDKPLDVYTGSVTLRLRLRALSPAAPGATTSPITLRYQACNDSSCLPPVKVPVSVQFEVAAAGAKSRAVHAEIFAATAPRN
jgi:DsbC/DsbD-like thiol-disulfide interchange protein